MNRSLALLIAFSIISVFCKAQSQPPFRGVTAYACVTNVNTEQIHFSYFDVDSPRNQTVINGLDLYGGIYYNGFLYAYEIYPEGDFPYFNRIDYTTGECLWWEYSPQIMNEMTFDYTTMTCYGTYNNKLYTVNMSNGDPTEIGAFPTSDPIYVLACHPNGTLYAISGGENSALYIVNKNNANLTYIGRTGIDEDYTILYLQTGTFDYETETLYWAGYETDTYIYMYDDSSFSTVDLETGQRTVLAWNVDSQLCLTIPFDDSALLPKGSQLTGEYIMVNPEHFGAQLSWNFEAQNCITEYHIYKSSTPSDFEYLGSCGKDLTSYTDVTGAGNAYYQVRAVYNNGLESEPFTTPDGSDYVCVNITNLDEELTLEPTLYPNPAQNTVQISNIVVKSIVIYNNLGQVVKMADGVSSIDVHDLESGLYTIVINGSVRRTLAVI